MGPTLRSILQHRLQRPVCHTGDSIIPLPSAEHGEGILPEHVHPGRILRCGQGHGIGGIYIVPRDRTAWEVEIIVDAPDLARWSRLVPVDVYPALMEEAIESRRRHGAALRWYKPSYSRGGAEMQVVYSLVVKGDLRAAWIAGTRLRRNVERAVRRQYRRHVLHCR